jgi:hypothetical protein
MRVETRVKEKVDAIPGAELQCSICRDWKPTNDFYLQKSRAKKTINAYYQSFCVRCTKTREGLRIRYGPNKRNPSHQEVREALGGDVSDYAGASFHRAGHRGNGNSTPLSPLAKVELQERREREEGKPDLCYLVGMEGDNSAVKIGHSTNIPRRLGQYQAGNPRKLEVIATMPGGKAKERELHCKFMPYHMAWMVGEWFMKGPAIINEFEVSK